MSEPKRSTNQERTILARVTKETDESLRAYALVTGTSITQVVRDAIAEYLQNHGHSDMVRAAFEKTLEQHREAFERLAKL